MHASNMNRRAALGFLGVAGTAILMFPARVASAGFQVAHSPADWRRLLGAQRYAVLREAATEPAFSSPLLKEHRKGQEQDATISQLKSTLVQQHNDFQSALADQQKQIKALTAALQDQAAQIQKVSVQLVADKKTSYVVVNDR